MVDGDWTERVSVLASLLPDDLTDLSTLSDEEHQLVIDIVQIIKARFDPRPAYST